MSDLTQLQLREVLFFDEDSGEFFWKVDRRGTAKAGTRAGSVEPNGYIQIWVFGKRYRAHRLAWLYVYAHWPTEAVDHRDGIRSNNAIRNLRLASTAQNIQNQRRAHLDNPSGLLGVSKKGGKVGR